VSIDDRWFLWTRPRIIASGDRVVSRFRTLTSELGSDLKKQKTPKATVRALDTWWKRRGAELERLLRAVRTFEDSADRTEIETLRREFTKVIGERATQPGIAERLNALIPMVGKGRTGVVSCDTYIEKMRLCARQLPPEAMSSMTNAMDQVVDAWVVAASTQEGREAMEGACMAATEAAAGSMSALCPGVF